MGLHANISTLYILIIIIVHIQLNLVQMTSFLRSVWHVRSDLEFSQRSFLEKSIKFIVPALEAYLTFLLTWFDEYKY